MLAENSVAAADETIPVAAANVRVYAFYLYLLALNYAKS
jgi:hypothetical protein